MARRLPMLPIATLVTGGVTSLIGTTLFVSGFQRVPVSKSSLFVGIALMGLGVALDFAARAADYAD